MLKFIPVSVIIVEQDLEKYLSRLTPNCIS